MRALRVAIAAILLSVSFAACGQRENTSTGNNGQSTGVSTTPKTAPAPGNKRNKKSTHSPGGRPKVTHNQTNSPPAG
jgi:hypothetical protein